MTNWIPSNLNYIGTWAKLRVRVISLSTSKVPYKSIDLASLLAGCEYLVLCDFANFLIYICDAGVTVF